MDEISDKKKIVENIRKEIEASKNTHIWSDYVNALKLISQVVFTRSSGFILELIQNAEDAGLGMENAGVFEIRLNQDRVKIVHNGRPFSDNDVKAICGIRSSKKPERGTLGYLGIGFKSVFKVTDCPEVYSNGFLFKFDRNHAGWDDPINTPWHVIPIWIDKPSEVIDVPKTTFIIPYREKTYYSSLLEEIRRLRTELYLFLRWLKKIEIIDEVTEQRWMLENATESEDGITTLRHDSKEQKFKFFHRTIKVPDSVKQDRLTQEYRANVTKREIAIAFALDEEGNLAPSEAGAMYGGVYSFLPLGEARSGAKFPIQADFLVQPGRDAINYEAKWNHWIVEEVTTLCKEAIDFFKKHEKWRYQFLPAFEFTKSKGLESYDILFGPKLVEPVEKFMKDDDCVPTIDGNWAKPHMVVRLTEDQKSISDLETMGVVKKDEITYVMGGESGLKIVAAGTKECKCHPIREVGRLDILKNKTFLERNCQEPDAVEWFRALYNWLYKNPIRIITRSCNTGGRVNQEEYDRNWRRKDGRTYREYRERYDDFEFILTADMRLLKGGDVTLLDLVPSDLMLKELADTVQKSRSVLHPDLLAGTISEEEQKAIKGFLTGYTGVQVIDSAKVCKDSLLPKILTNSPKPLPEDLLKYTSCCQKILGDGIPKGSEFWVLTKDDDVRAAKEVFFPTVFKPEQNWEIYKQYVSGLSFISPQYVANVTNDDELQAWRQFFKAGGVKDSPDNGIEEFAMNYVEEKLKTFCKYVKRVDKRNFGYDIETETQTGEKMYVEVKGLSSERDIELTSNETDAADRYKETFYLCVISSILENPTAHIVQNPAAPGVGKKDKLTIPINIWKVATWPKS